METKAIRSADGLALNPNRDQRQQQPGQDRSQQQARQRPEPPDQRAVGPGPTGGMSIADLLGATLGHYQDEAAHLDLLR